MRKKERNKLILERLEETYKGQGTALHYTTPLNSWWRSSFLLSARMNGSILLQSAFSKVQYAGEAGRPDP